MIPIEQLNAWSLNSVRQSLDKYNKYDQRENKLDFYDSNVTRDYDNREAKMGKYRRGSGWGLEDEYRYLVGEKGFQGVSGGGGAAPAAAAAPYQAPTSQGQSSVNFSNQLAAIKAQNQTSINALTKQLADQKTDYDAREVASNKKISGLASTVANAQSQYDPTKGMGSSNNINPALTIQEKSNSLSSGTQRYNRGKLSINNLNV